ncbi:MAG: protease modulator HflC [Desulfovibrionaceae bacterium]
MKRTQIVILAAVALLLLVGTQCLFMVDQTERALVLQLGKPVGKEALNPGLHFKLPFIQNVLFLDARILGYDAKPEEITTLDKKYMHVDSYAKWRITNPLEFYRSFKTVTNAMSRLDDIVRSQLRVVLGRYTLHQVVSEGRIEIMAQILAGCQELLSPFGIEVVDVRIKRTDLPQENARAIFGRMQAERERQAKEYRAEGQRESDTIKAQADKERSVILAEANKQSEIIRGQADAKATAIYAQALEQDPQFYELVRSLEAYRKGLKGDTKVILTQQSPFLKFFK